MDTTADNTQGQNPAPARKALVAYFSHSGNTREIAEQITAETGADTFEIIPVDAYPMDYDTVVEQAKRELHANYRPALKSQVVNLESYDVIFVGSPNWWNTMAPPVVTFLSTSNLAGKTIVPFITHEGSRLGNSVADVKKLGLGATVLEGHAFRGGSVKNALGEVRQWLNGIRLLNEPL